MNLYDLFEIQFRRCSEKPALRFESREISFRELEQFAGKVAGRFCNFGLRPGDRVALYLHNSIELIAAYLANLQLGLVTVPMNTQYRDTEILHIVSDSRSRLILTDPEGMTLLQSLRDRMEAVERLVGAEELRGCMLTAEGNACRKRTGVVGGEDLAAILYTSGTTGKSKGAMMTHNNFMSNIAALTLAWNWTSADVLLLALPLFHTHGLGVALHGALATGCTTVLHRAFHAERVLAALREERISLFMGTPTMYARLLEKAGDAVSLPEMRLFVSGSAPLSPETFHRFEQVFGHRILERYGMTETLMNISNPYVGQRLPGTVGLPLPGVSVRIAGEDGAALPDGDIGEVLLRGPNIFAGYWQDPGKTEASFHADPADGTRWFRSGDLGRRDPATRYCQLLGRKHELIISGGYNIYPREVEEWIAGHPAVLEAAVVARADAALGEVPAACVVLKPGMQLSAEELIEHCNAHMARYKVPRTVRFLEALPRNAMGKVDKSKL